MRITNRDIPGLPGYEVDYTNAAAPWFWVGQRAVDGTAEPWAGAPLGSLYLYIAAATSATLYVKVADAAATADWVLPVTSAGGQTVAGALTLGAALRTTANVGAGVAQKSTPTEYGDGIVHQTVLTLDFTGGRVITLADGADKTKGELLYTFPAGRIAILGVVADFTITNDDGFNASTNDVFVWAIGSADGTQAANATLTSTEADLIASQTVDTDSGATLTRAAHVQSATATHTFQYDGTGTAAKVYLNVGVTDASTSTAVNIGFAGTLTITWINLGDY